MSNELFNQMLSAYDLATHQPPSTEAPAYASSMACNDSPRTWTSRYLLQAKTLTSHNTFNP